MDLQLLYFWNSDEQKTVTYTVCYSLNQILKYLISNGDKFAGINNPWLFLVKLKNLTKFPLDVSKNREIFFTQIYQTPRLSLDARLRNLALDFSPSVHF